MIEELSNKKAKKHIAVFTWKKAAILIGLFTVFFIIGSFFDFEISKTLYAGDKITRRQLGSFLTDNLLYISWAAIAAIFVACARSSFVYKNNKVWVTIIINIFAWAYIGYEVYRSLSSFATWEHLLGRTGSIIYNTLYNIVVYSIAIYFGLFCFKNLDQKLVVKITFWFMIICFAVSTFREFLAILASRPRPRVIFDSENPQSAFVPWWVFNPFHCYDKSIKTGLFYMSFPSGHSAETFFIVGFAGILYRVKLIKTWKTANVVFGISILIACLAPFGRVLGGWHYTSDVSFGALLSIISFFIMTFFLDWRSKKKTLF